MRPMPSVRQPEGGGAMTDDRPIRPSKYYDAFMRDQLEATKERQRRHQDKVEEARQLAEDIRNARANSGRS
jgi:hypothetical protein